MPTPEELGHDYLWRYRKAAPLKGQITADVCCDNLIKGIADAKRKV